MKKLCCYGDSNTYGYDPRNFGGRYPREDRWTDLLPGFEVHNNGMNGRFVPRRPEKLPAGFDLYLIMLGTNDLLDGATAAETAGLMDRFLQSLPMDKLLLIAPPPLRPGAWIEAPSMLTESAELGACYRSVAQKNGIQFLDAADWNVELCFDGVHFTEVGHHSFAAGLLPHILTRFA